MSLTLYAVLVDLYYLWSESSENAYRLSRDTYANMVLFRLRLSFFATERYCLRLAAASGLVANCRITVKYLATN